MDKILVIDDDESIRTTLVNYLQKQNYQVFSAENGLAGFEIIKKERPDLIITDIRMPEMGGFDLLLKLKSHSINTNVIMMTAFDDMQTTVKAIQKGAYDYVEKPIDLDRLKHSIKISLDNKRLTEKLEAIEYEVADKNDIKNTLIGKNEKMREIYKKIAQLSSNRITVLIQGESGTGKELVARAIHYSGNTKNFPFIAVNCTALTETLLESELFGHVKGAFTGSVGDKKGKFELAGEGTIFLDEISEISATLQIKLLRILQEKEFERVGGENLIPVKARIIAATNKNLERLVAEDKFREDLFYRLNVVSLTIPPLRERKEDIPILVNHLLTKINNELHKKVLKVSDSVLKMLIEHDWTGNVRELENTLTQAVVLAKGEMIEGENLYLNTLKTNVYEFDNFLNYPLRDIEKMHIENVLKHLKGDKPKASKILGVSLPTLYSKIESYKIAQK